VVGYSGDCRVLGQLEQGDGRLSDLLNRNMSVALRDVSLEGLGDGHVLSLPAVEVEREELFAIHDEGHDVTSVRRVSARPFRIRLFAGPYEIAGHLHVRPGVDPLAAFVRRERMVPLTEVALSYEFNGQRIVEELDTLIVNRDLVSHAERLEPRPMGAAVA
jgi:hypothetical protein